jgi:ADP-heptose:LPS heptosyltransferase
MGEKYLYFCNILVSRWVNALNSHGLRLQYSMRSRMDQSSVQPNVHSLRKSNPPNLRNSSLGQSNSSGEKLLKLPIKSILVVKWDEIGDMATAVHVFGMLKSAYPEAKITVLCKPFVASLIAGDPAVDEVIMDVENWQHRYNVVVELRGTWKTLWKSLAFRTMPKYRVDRGWVRFLQRGAQPHEVITNERIIRPLLDENLPIVKSVLYPSESEISEAKGWSDWALSGADSMDMVGYAILHTGARRELRRWPLERFVSLSKWLKKDKKLLPIWVGTVDEEHQLNEAFALGAAGKKWVAPDGSSLLSFYAFIASAKLYVGNESGPLQLANIAQIPLIAIYGPGVPNVFYPMSDRSRVLHEVLDCNPCDQIHCVRQNDRCIDRISLASVQLGVNELLT